LYHHLPSRRRDPARRERGTAVVEAAFVSLAFFTIIAIVFEGSGLIRDSLGVANMVRAGARTATVNGNDPSADYYILPTIKKEANSVGLDDLRLVVVYEANGFGNPPSDTCKGGTAVTTGTGECNVYTRSDLSRPQSDFACKNAALLDGPWCPTDRKTAETGTNGPPDYIGVYVKYTHDLVTGLFRGTSTMTDFVVVRMEPRTNQ
jgi:hypothetical protein